jgi:hypothetical protein
MDNVKTVIPSSFTPHELQKSMEITILQTRSCENLVDLLIKSSPASIFQIHVYGIDMRRLTKLQGLWGGNL